MTKKVLAWLSSFALVVATMLLAAAQPSQTTNAQKPSETTKGAPLFSDLGNFHHPITTDSAKAQRYFDQGMVLAYGFNHGEALRSFKEAARQDPECAMCYWGMALVRGPHLNSPMADDQVGPAWEDLQKARQLASKVSQREQAYIAALAKRYSDEKVSDRSKLDMAYAEAMRDVMKAYPDDLDAATLFAEAMMDTMPWDYYTEDRRPKALTTEILSALQSVLSQDPHHPGANHFYIHAVEASPNPERALPSAARLGKIAPGAGHLVHMPSHIYLRIGRYHDATLANERAVLADQSYIAQCRAQGFYPAAYYPHNLHFLWFTAGEEGRSELAIRTARQIDLMNEQHALAEGRRFSPLLVLTYVRFGKWDEALNQPLPPADQHFALAMTRYARGMAYAAKKQFEAAEKEHKELKAIAASDKVAAKDDSTLPGARLILLSHHVLTGEIAARKGEMNEMERAFATAIEVEDRLPYMEPPFWHHPVRQLLGAALLERGLAHRAEQVFREDLKRHPLNGWSLYGLLASLRAQGKNEEANAVNRQFRETWRLADVTLTSARF